MFDEFVKELIDARNNSGLSLQQMSAKSRIDKKFLEAIENKDFDFLPEIYVKAFIKDYAKLVGLDPEVTIKKFLAAKEGIKYVPDTEELTATPEGKNTEPQLKEKPIEKKPEVKLSVSNKIFDSEKADLNSASKNQKNNWLTENKNAFVFILSVLLILIAVFIYYQLVKTHEEIIVKEKPIEEVIKESSARFEKVEKPKEEIHSGTLKLLISATDTSWLKTKLDDDSTKVRDFMLYPNQQQQLNASEKFEITIGNSAGVKLFLNGKELPFVGKLKEVKHILITKNGLTVSN